MKSAVWAAPLLLLLAAAAFVPQLFLPEWRGTEPRRVQIATEMRLTGEYIVPQLWHEVTVTKPPLYNWILVGFQELFGVHRWSMRLPSALAFWLLAVLAFYHLRRWHGLGAAWLGSAAILLAPVVVHDVPFAEIDPVFAAFTGAAAVFLMDGILLSSLWRFVVAGLLCGMAFMTKGPPLFLFLAAPIVVATRRRCWVGLSTFAALAAIGPVLYYIQLTQVRSDVGSTAVVETVDRLKDYELKAILRSPFDFLAAMALTLPLGLWGLVRWRRKIALGISPERRSLIVTSWWCFFGAVLFLMVFPKRSTRYFLPGVALALMALAPVVVAYLRSLRERPAAWLRYTMVGVGMLGGLGLLALPFVPVPHVTMCAPFAMALGTAPLCRRSHTAVVAFAVGVTMVAAWTVIPAISALRAASARGLTGPGAILQREVESRQTGPLWKKGYVSSPIIMQSGLDVRDRPADSESELPKWLLIQHRVHSDREAPHAEAEKGYAERLRLRWYKHVLVLSERVE